MTTAQEAMEAVASEDAQAAGLLAAIMEHNAAQQVLMLPTWETVDREKAQAFDMGYHAGFDEAYRQINERIFADLHSNPRTHPARPGSITGKEF